jgi:hypothetical protein
MLKQTSIGRVIMEYINHDNSVEKTASKSAVDISEVRKASQSLEKLASLPYNHEAYEATQGVMKIASDMLLQAAQAIEDSKREISGLKKFAEVHSIIDEMLDSGLVDKSDAREKIAELLQKENLEVVKQAMSMVRGKSGNIFFDIDSVDSGSGHEKRGMFDDVINI